MLLILNGKELDENVPGSFSWLLGSDNLDGSVRCALRKANLDEAGGDASLKSYFLTKPASKMGAAPKWRRTGWGLQGWRCESRNRKC